MSRKHQRNVSINHMEIPDNVRRDVILEHDTVYSDNLRALTARAKSGKITPSEFSSLSRWLQESALRRAHVPRSEAPQLLHA